MKTMSPEQRKGCYRSKLETPGDVTTDKMKTKLCRKWLQLKARQQ